MVTLVEEAAWTADALVTPGRLRLVEALPFLRHLPVWFPGAEFKRAAAEMRKVMIEFVNVPYEFTKQALVSYLFLMDRSQTNFDHLLVSAYGTRLRMWIFRPISWPITLRLRTTIPHWRIISNGQQHLCTLVRVHEYLSSYV